MRAGRVDGDVFYGGDFTVGVPGEDFRVVHNRKQGDNVLVSFRNRDAHVDLSVNQVRMSNEMMDLPLVVIAEVAFQNMGRSRGIKTTLQEGKRIDIGEHEAYVVVGERTNDAYTRRVSQLFVRAGRQLFVMSYIASPEDYRAFASAFGRALDGFSVKLPANPPEMTLPEPPPDWDPLPPYETPSPTPSLE